MKRTYFIEIAYTIYTVSTLGIKKWKGYGENDALTN